MSGMHPGMLMQSMRRDRSVMEQRLTRRTLQRVIGFARPHGRLIGMFLVFVVLVVPSVSKALGILSLVSWVLLGALRSLYQGHRDIRPSSGIAFIHFCYSSP